MAPCRTLQEVLRRRHTQKPPGVSRRQKKEGASVTPRDLRRRQVSRFGAWLGDPPASWMRSRSAQITAQEEEARQERLRRLGTVCLVAHRSRFFIREVGGGR
jgi:hypothetical protein